MYKFIIYVGNPMASNRCICRVIYFVLRPGRMHCLATLAGIRPRLSAEHHYKYLLN